MNTFLSYLLGCFLILSPVFSAQASSDGPTAIGFQFCPNKDCFPKVEFSSCDKNATTEGGKCVCLPGFIGDGKHCVRPTCSNGRYSLVDEDGIEVCKICPAGYFCTEGLKKKCPDNSISEKGAFSCEPCPEGTYTEGDLNVYCPEGQKYDPTRKECISCLTGESCRCPQQTPYTDGNGKCVECTLDEHCPTGSCSDQICCPENSSTFLETDEQLNNGCYCQPGYQANSEGNLCVPSPCSSIENSSPTGTGDKTSLDGCFCDINYPYWRNGKCMPIGNCALLMEKYGFRKDIDFQEPYQTEEQTFLNTIYVSDFFNPPSNMNLTGCSLFIDGSFQNKNKLIVDKLYINSFDSQYKDQYSANNTGTLMVKELTASNFTNGGIIIAPSASVKFGHFENRGRISVNTIRELDNSPAVIKNIGALTVSSDFLFGARSTTGSVQNSGIISVGGNWESNDIYNWGWISVRKRIKRKNIKIHNEGRIIEYGNN